MSLALLCLLCQALLSGPAARPKQCQTDSRMQMDLIAVGRCREEPHFTPQVWAGAAKEIQVFCEASQKYLITT